MFQTPRGNGAFLRGGCLCLTSLASLFSLPTKMLSGSDILAALLEKRGRVVDASLFSIDTNFVDVHDLSQSPSAPDYLTIFNIFEDDIHLLAMGIVDNLQKADNVGMTGLFQDGNFFLHFVLWIPKSPQTAALRMPLDDLDSNLFSGFDMLT